MPNRRKPPQWVRRVYHLLRRENLHRILLFLAAMTVLTALALSVLEPQAPLEDWLWWSIVTMTTVGYGDITPSTLPGRAIGVVLMVCGIGVLSVFTATVASFFLEIKLRSERGMGSFDVKDHFIFCEWNDRARKVLQELRSDRRARASPVVILADIDQKPVFDDDVHFIRGETSEENLSRAGLATASTVIIFGDDALDPASRDAKVVLSTLTVEGMRPEVYTIVELVREENARHVERARADEIIIGDEFSSRLIASSAVDHGISKVLSEILSTRYGQELRRVPVPAGLAGKSFLEILSAMKRSNQSTVLAVQRDKEVVTNPPADYALEPSDQLIVIADPDAAG